jgi:hypothetical protein
MFGAGRMTKNKQLIMIQAIKTNSNYNPLRIIKGNKEYEQQVQHLSAIAWKIAYTALWNAEEFSAVEKEKALELISGFIREHNSPKKGYGVFVQRVLLARQYISTHPGAYAPIPSQWLSLSNKNGFAGTQRWYDAVETMRISMPKYKQPLKAFSEAVLETTLFGSAKDFHYWRSYFAENNCQGLLNLFLSVIANCSHE